MPYLDLLTINGLVERVEGEKLRFRTTLKGAQALHHFQEIEKLMPEMEVQEEPALRLQRCIYYYYFLEIYLAIIVEFEIYIDSDSMFQWSHVFSDMEMALVAMVQERDDFQLLQWSDVFSDMKEDIRLLKCNMSFVSYNAACFPRLSRSGFLSRSTMNCRLMLSLINRPKRSPSSMMSQLRRA